MGLDFIRRAAPSFQKAWDKGRDDLAKPDLFTQHPECGRRSVLADVVRNDLVSPGDQVVLQTDGPRLVAYRALTPVAVIAEVPTDLARVLEGCGGTALGTIERVYEVSGTADIQVT